MLLTSAQQRYLDGIQVVIPAGGFATRLGSLTMQLPKILLPINGKPFLWHLITWLSMQGIQQVHLCLGYMAQKVIEVLPQLPPTMNITYTIEDQPLGVAGALRYSRNYLRQVFVLIYGDVRPNVSLVKPIQHFYISNCAGLLTVIHNENARETSNIIVKNGMVVDYCTELERQVCTHLDVGVTVLRYETLDLIPDGSFLSEKDFYKHLLALGMLSAYETDQASYEIGSIEGYETFQRETLRKENV